MSELQSPVPVEKQKSIKRLPVWVLTVLTLLLLCGTVYLAAVLMTDDAAQRVASVEPADILPLQAGTGRGTDAALKLFGSPLPVIQDRDVQYTAQNIRVGDENGRMITLVFSSGYMVQAVTPVECAECLSEKGEEILSTVTLRTLDAQAVYSVTSEKRRLCFEAGNCVYVFSGTGSEEEFLSRAGSLFWLR